MALVVAQYYMDLTAVLSTVLQGKQVDFVRAMAEVHTLISQFEGIYHCACALLYISVNSY